jgi:hypothetical protein
MSSWWRLGHHGIRSIARRAPTRTMACAALVLGIVGFQTSTQMTPQPAFAQAAPNLTDTTVADFSAGTVPSGVRVTDVTNGELRLRAAHEDYFDAAPSASNWTWGTWGGGTFSPSPTGGILPVSRPGNQGAWLRSVGTFTRATASGQVSFGSGPREDFGFGDSSLASRYALLSTSTDAAGVYARTANGGTETRTLLPGVTLNAFHTVQIVWGLSSVTYFVDGVQKASHTASISTPLNVWLSNNSSSATLNADWVRGESYATTSTTYTSATIDNVSSATWGTLT